jgi:hypothetical protein
MTTDTDTYTEPNDTSKMENLIVEYEDSASLIEENPYNNGYQSPIYLLLDWENNTIDVDTYYETNSMPMDIFHGLRTRIRLPNNINASYFHSDIDDIIDRINTIRAGYESQWNGHNWIGNFTDEAEAELNSLTYDIEEHPYTLFHLLDDGAGIWDVDDYYAYGNPDDLYASMTDIEIRELAEYEYDNALSNYVKIRGGLDSLYNFLIGARDELIEEEESNNDEDDDS